MSMDLNHLLYHHQLSIMQAASLPAVSRAGAYRLVKHYQTRIDRLRHQMGVSSYPDWCGAAVPAGAVS
jgi:transposase-like protein